MTVLFFYLYYLYCLSIFQRTNVASAAPAFFAKADAKIRTFSDNLQTFLKVFCFYFLNHLLFSRMSIIRLCLSSKAGAKVDNLSITSKYIGLFFYSFLKLFCNSLIDNDVIEYIFSDRHILIWNTYTLLYSALKCKFYFPIPNRNSIYIQDSTIHFSILRVSALKFIPILK